MEIQMNASTTTYYLKMCRVLQGWLDRKKQWTRPTDFLCQQ
jgi:hypothetical protein